MSFETGFLDLMPATVTRNAFTKRANDGYGGPSFSTAVSSYRARVVQSPLLIQNAQGMEVVVTHTAWLATTASIQPEDKITYLGSTYQIQEIGRFPDDQGGHHTRLRLRG